MLDAVVSLGTTFWLKLIGTESTLLTYRAEAPAEFELGLTVTYENVPVEVEVFCGKSIFATGLAEAVAALVPLVIAQPVAPVERSVAIRVYWA